MKTATLIRDNLDEFRGHAALYKLSEPVIYREDDVSDNERVTQYTNYVVCSSVFHDFVSELENLGIKPNEEIKHLLKVKETYIFPADEHGNLYSLNELPGSMKDTQDHMEVLKKAGFILIPFATEKLKIKLNIK